MLLAFACFLINGLANNAIIPIAEKISDTYGLEPEIASLPITLSFLVFFIANFPANHIVDKYGLKVGFICGLGFYVAGLVLFNLIEHSFTYAILGTVLVSVGQPFIVNTPAKISTFWFNH